MRRQCRRVVKDYSISLILVVGNSNRRVGFLDSVLYIILYIFINTYDHHSCSFRLIFRHYLPQHLF